MISFVKFDFTSNIFHCAKSLFKKLCRSDLELSTSFNYLFFVFDVIVCLLGSGVLFKICVRQTRTVESYEMETSYIVFTQLALP